MAAAVRGNTVGGIDVALDGGVAVGGQPKSQIASAVEISHNAVKLVTVVGIRGLNSSSRKNDSSRQVRSSSLDQVEESAAITENEQIFGGRRGCDIIHVIFGKGAGNASVHGDTDLSCLVVVKHHAQV